MACKARHRFAINLSELAYVSGLGRAAMLFLSIVTISNFFLNTGVYLDLLRSILFGLNCEWDIIPSLEKSSKGVMFCFVFAITLALYPLILKVITLKITKIWYKVIGAAMIAIVMISGIMAIWSLATATEI